jgi:phosphopantetheine adenylyltransferase
MKKKVSERTLTSKQAVTQMNHYWKDLDHMASDVVKKKNMDRRFGIKDIKLDRYGNIVSFDKYKRGAFEELEIDEALIAEAGNICSVDRSDLKSKAMQTAWDKKCSSGKPKKKSIFGKIGRDLNLYNQSEEKKISSFGQFLEAKQKTVVFSFGRFNPPTIGHQKLLQKIIQTAKQLGGQPKLFVSYSQDSKKNPLTASKKIAHIKKMFPTETRQLELKDNSNIKNAIDVATELNGKYDKLVMVVGSDRVRDFKALLNKYNDVESKHGSYKYQDIQIVSAGERDPDAEGVAGMSASKMRAAAASGDYESFSLGLPSTFKQGEKLFKDIRLGMNVKEQLKPFKPIVEMSNMELVREQYFQNLIYNIGDWVKDTKAKITGEVVKRGTNYLTIVQEDFTLHKVWLEDAESMEEQHKKLPKAINFLKNRNLWEKVQREGRKSAGEKEDSHKKEWGTKELTNRCKRITPGETVKESVDGLKKFASKFKIPMNVAKVIYKKLIHAGVDPLKIQQYSTLLSTYINLMDEKLPEVAPPGKEKQILKLKKKFGKDSDIPYKIAWSQHNKEKG